MIQLTFKTVKHNDRDNVLAVVIGKEDNLLCYELFKEEGSLVSRHYIKRSCRNSTPNEKTALTSQLKRMGIQFTEVSSLKG